MAVDSFLDVFRSDVGKFRARLKKTREELETARRRREELLTVPLPPADVAELLCQLIDRSARQYPIRLQHKIDFILRKPLMDATNPGLQQFHPLLPAEGMNTPFPADLESAVSFLFTDVVKEGIRRALVQMRYAHGPGRIERVAELQKLETRIAELEQQEKTMASELNTMVNELAG